jgi:hypothetical protein
MQTTEVKPEVVKEKRKPGAQPGRVMTEAQREGLKKGFAALQAKREQIKKEKEAKKASSLPKPDTPADLPVNNQVITEPVVNKPLDTPAPLVIAKKSRNRIPAVSKPDFEAFKNDLYSRLGQQPHVALQQGQTVAKVEEVKDIVKSVPQQQQVLSGSALLNKIFFNK